VNVIIFDAPLVVLARLQVYYVLPFMHWILCTWRPAIIVCYNIRKQIDESCWSVAFFDSGGKSIPKATSMEWAEYSTHFDLTMECTLRLANQLRN